MFGAKLSWCQIVRCQIVLVPNCPAAKLAWCQIVRGQIALPPGKLFSNPILLNIGTIGFDNEKRK